MKKVFFIFLLLLGFISPALAKDQGKSVYDRVMESKTLRCGYLPYEPWVSVDPNSGTVSGITREYMDAVGATKGITVEWTGEVNIDQAVPAIEAGRFDAICIPSTPDHNWEKVLNFSGYLGGLPYFVYVPKDSNATDETLKQPGLQRRMGLP
jgi:ABC-type amino acid transport substrate-binding protein